MSTTTDLPPEAATEAADTLPKWPGLAIDNACLARGDRLEEVRGNHADCLAFEAEVEGLQQDRLALLAGAIDRKLKTVLDQAAGLRSRRTELEARLVELRWARFDLVPRLLPDFEAAVKAANNDYERTIEEETRRFAKLGIDGSCMQAREYNERAAARQLRRRITEEVTVLAAKGRLNRAEAARESLAARLQIPPRANTCQITWRPVGDPLHQQIAIMAGVA